MTADPYAELVSLGTHHPIWDRFFWVAPLVVIGTREMSSEFDLAPKHMVRPLGWQNYFSFVCTPKHATYRNAQREKAFTVSYPRPDQVVIGKVLAAHVHPDAAHREDRDDQDVVRDCPVLAYLSPGRFAAIRDTHSFPLPEGFSR